jgi:hypothetical protein
MLRMHVLALIYFQWQMRTREALLPSDTVPLGTSSDLLIHSLVSHLEMSTWIYSGKLPLLLEPERIAVHEINFGSFSSLVSSFLGSNWPTIDVLYSVCH